MWDKKNGFTRPLPGTKTGIIWDIMDAYYKERGVVPTYAEVWKIYRDQVSDAKETTCRTQSSRWLGYHGLREASREQKAAAGPVPELSTKLKSLLEKFIAVAERIAVQLERLP